jgi:hypothetical protein
VTDHRPWYREPETFIAVAALVVSVTAVVVGIYEASLQRAHDRAEVWPHLEISTWLNGNAALVRLENTGLGPAVVKFMEVRVDGTPQDSWDDALRALYGHEPPPHSNSTVRNHSLRGGDRAELVSVPEKEAPRPFWPWIGRVVVRACYASVFDSYWIVTDTLGKPDRWQETLGCPAQADDTGL